MGSQHPRPARRFPCDGLCGSRGSRGRGGDADGRPRWWSGRRGGSDGGLCHDGVTGASLLPAQAAGPAEVLPSAAASPALSLPPWLRRRPPSVSRCGARAAGRPAMRPRRHAAARPVWRGSESNRCGGGGAGALAGHAADDRGPAAQRPRGPRKAAAVGRGGFAGGVASRRRPSAYTLHIMHIRGHGGASVPSEPASRPYHCGRFFVAAICSRTLLDQKLRPRYLRGIPAHSLPSAPPPHLFLNSDCRLRIAMLAPAGWGRAEGSSVGNFAALAPSRVAQSRWNIRVVQRQSVG